MADVFTPEKLRKQWVVRNGDTIPFQLDLTTKADVTDPATWSYFQDVEKAIDGKKGFEPGFILVPPYVGIDLDTYNATDPNILNIHEWIFKLFPNTYSEWSPRNGIHILCKGTIPYVRKLGHIHVEIYDSKRYFTYTKRFIHELPIIGYQPALDEMFRALTLYYPPSSFNGTPNGTSNVDGPEVATDIEICKMAANAENGELFKELYLGHWEGRYLSQSEADQALANIIAFYTDNRTQCARIFHDSALGKRKKAHRQNYLYSDKYGIITRAFDKKLPLPFDLATLDQQFQQTVVGHNGTVQQTHDAAKAAPVQVAPLVEVTPTPAVQPTESDSTDLDYPPGLVGDAARFFYSKAHLPNKHVAIAASIGFFAGLTGRAYNINGTGLNQYS